MAGQKTEKATPKRRDEARKKGQVARSADLNGAVVMAAGLLALGAFGPRLVEEMATSMRDFLTLIARPEVVNGGNMGELMGASARSIAVSVAPIAVACALAGLGTSVAQVKWRPSAKVLKPDFKRMDPIKGAKNIFGPNALFEGAKTVVKTIAVGGIAALALFPELPEMAALVGLPPADLAAKLVSITMAIAWRATAAYFVLAICDYVWQHHRQEKQLRMDKQEVKDEVKQQAVPEEVRSAQRRRQMQGARARMMSAVPEADVVVTNPTHYAVALAYDGSKLAPEVVAKGQDLIALQIRRIAAEHGVAVVENPPLARSLHASVEVGHPIPEELFGAVAQLLAFVYRVAGRRAA